MFGAFAPPDGNVVRRHVSEGNATQNFRPRLLIYGAIASTNSRLCRNIGPRKALDNSHQDLTCSASLDE
jgi:hypothetical protein